MSTLRLVFSALLILALALPLSTCSLQNEANVQSEPIERYLLSGDSSLRAWGWALGFLLPGAMAFGLRKSVPSLTSELLCTVSVVPASLVIWWHASLGSLALGGWLALSAILLYLGVTLLILHRIIREKVAISDG